MFPLIHLNNVRFWTPASAHCSLFSQTATYSSVSSSPDDHRWVWVEIFKTVYADDNWIKCVKLLSGPTTSLQHKGKHLSLFAAWKLPPRTQLPQVQLFPCRFSGTEEYPSFSTPKRLESWWPDFLIFTQVFYVHLTNIWPIKVNRALSFNRIKITWKSSWQPLRAAIPKHLSAFDWIRIGRISNGSI